eukprot:scaffold259789_cov30-Tisochrysis_lutea.AAC.1
MGALPWPRLRRNHGATVTEEAFRLRLPAYCTSRACRALVRGLSRNDWKGVALSPRKVSSGWLLAARPLNTYL